MIFRRGVSATALGDDVVTIVPIRSEFLGGWPPAINARGPLRLLLFYGSLKQLTRSIPARRSFRQLLKGRKLSGYNDRRTGKERYERRQVLRDVKWGLFLRVRAASSLFLCIKQMTEQAAVTRPPRPADVIQKTHCSFS